MINPSAISRLLRGAGCRMATSLGAGLRVRRASTHYAEVLAVGYGPDTERAFANLAKAQAVLKKHGYVSSPVRIPVGYGIMMRVCEGGAW